MPDTELITIGAFARACGLSASALRFYADAGILVPAAIDEATGYRYYAPDQSAPARLLRDLRAVDMSLPAITTLLAEPDPIRAIALLDDHLTDLDRHQDTIRAAATAARAALLALRGSDSQRRIGDQGSVRLDSWADGRSTGAPAATTATGPAAPAVTPMSTASAPDTPTATPSPRATVRNTEHAFQRPPKPHRNDLWVSGPALAVAIDQVVTATVTDPTMRVLDTILFEADQQELILTATDRYRLTTRTLRPTRPAATTWTATIDAEDLRAAVSWLRREQFVALRPTPDGLEFATVTAHSDVGPVAAHSGEVSVGFGETVGASCRRSTEDFPDYRAMLAALPAVRTRIVLARTDLLDALENASAPTIALRVFPPSTVTVTPSDPLPRHGDQRVGHADVHCAHDECVTPGAAMPDRAATISAVGSTSGTVAPARPASPAQTRRDAAERALPASVTGPSMTIHFTVTTLYLAVAGAVGADVMLDIIAPDLPVRVRSADDGDLLVLAMPCKPT